MLLPQQRMRLLQLLQLPNLSHRGGRDRPGPTPNPAKPNLLAPLGEHEGMNVERGSDGLHLNPRLLAQAYRSQLELWTVPLGLPRTGSGHRHLLLVR